MVSALTDKAARNASPREKPYKLSDAAGGGLYLFVARTGAKSWRVNYTFNGTQRTATLGLYLPAGAGTAIAPSMTLADARKAALKVREQVAAGVDPSAEKRRAADAAQTAALQAEEARREAEIAEQARRQAASAEKAAEALTLWRACRAYHEKIEPKFRNAKHAQQWINSIEQHVPQELLSARLDRITPDQLLDAVVDVSRKLPETGSRVAQRLAGVFADAVFRRQVPHDPMAGVIRRARELLGKRPAPVHHSALPYSLIAAAYKALLGKPGAAAQALRLVILTAARSGEVRGMTWGEVDLQAATWTVPAHRMKAGQQHLVALSEPAVELLRALQAQAGDKARFDALVFQSPWSKGLLTPDALEDCLDSVVIEIGFKARATVHGMRAAFSTWAAEGNFAREDVIEAALAHRESDRVKRAYQRSAFEAERRALLERWGRFVTGAKADVIELPTAVPRAA